MLVPSMKLAGEVWQAVKIEEVSLQSLYWTLTLV